MSRLKGFGCLLTAFALIAFPLSSGFAQVEFTEHVITNDINGPHAIWIADLDSDGDMDVIAVASYANELVWYENDGDMEFTENTIESNYTYAHSVHTVDMDDDGDMDIISCARDDDSLSWFENDGNQDFTHHLVSTGSTNLDFPRYVQGIDMDGDDDIDIFATADMGYDVKWFENDGDQEFTYHSISDGTYMAYSGYAIDMDGDNDIDVLCASLTANTFITWWENDGDMGFEEHTVDDTTTQGRGVYAIDMDGDDDIDILGSSWSNYVIWYENDGDMEFTIHTITDSLIGSWHSWADDLDWDGDIDVMGGGHESDIITWYENDGEMEFTEHTLAEAFDGPIYIMSGDMDGDSDKDIIAAAFFGNTIAWYENNLDPPTDASVSGTVTDVETGDPIEDATVIFGRFDAVTDENGEYEIEDLYSIIDYTVRIEAEGYEPHIEQGVEIETGENTYDVELYFPASLIFDYDSLRIISPIDEVDSTVFTIGNEGDVDLRWRLSTDGSDWLSFNQTSGSVEPEGECDITAYGDAEGMEEDGYSDTLTLRTNDPDNPVIRIPVYFYVDYQAPGTFNLLEPDSGFWSFVADIDLAWSTAADDDPDERVLYEIYISDDPDTLGFPDDIITGTTFMYEAPTQRWYYWTVCARDQLGLRTWANQTWSFFMDYPERPSAFNLVEPENGANFEFVEGDTTGMGIDFVWEASIDPDPQENPVYTLKLLVTLGDGSEDTLTHDRWRDTVLTVDIPEELEIGEWTEALEVEWWVEALSGEDVQECEEHFTFTIAPYSSVPERIFSGVPEVYSIAAAYPNPFNPILTAVIGLPMTADLKVVVSNILGKEVAVLADGTHIQGYHRFIFNASELSSGAYFIRATVPGKLNDVRKVVLIR